MANPEREPESKSLPSEQAVLEENVGTLEKNVMSLSRGQRDRLHRALGKAEKADANNSQIGALRMRFLAHPERHEGLEWASVEKALEAHPEKVAVLQKIAQIGGEPDLLEVGEDSFVFVDFSKDLPDECRNMLLEEAVDLARDLGADMISETHLSMLQKVMPLGNNGGCWCAEDVKIKGSGDAGMLRRFASWFVSSVVGLRVSVKVPKAG